VFSLVSHTDHCSVHWRLFRNRRHREEVSERKELVQAQTGSNKKEVFICASPIFKDS